MFNINFGTEIDPEVGPTTGNNHRIALLCAYTQPYNIGEIPYCTQGFSYSWWDMDWWDSSPLNRLPPFSPTSKKELVPCTTAYYVGMRTTPLWIKNKAKCSKIAINPLKSKEILGNWHPRVRNKGEYYAHPLSISEIRIVPLYLPTYLPTYNIHLD